MKTAKTKIEFDWNGKHITLEYTADSLRKMEERGFDIGVIDKRLITVGETLFSGAFIANHDDIDEEIRRELYNEISSYDDDGNGEKIEEVLAKMLQEAVDEMQSHRGNLKWRMAK